MSEQTNEQAEHEDDGAFLARMAEPMAYIGVALFDFRRLRALAGTQTDSGWHSWRDTAAEAVRQGQEAMRERDTAKVDARTAWLRVDEACETVERLEADLAALRAEFVPAVRALADDIRAAGWVVAVHNDYRQDGRAHTFWLFTRGDRCVKGEGLTDAEALDQVRHALFSPLAQAVLKSKEGSDGDSSLGAE